MIAGRIPTFLRDSSIWGLLVLLGSVTIAIVSARDHVGGWNDGSRLATVECLVDHHTLMIDQSVFTPDTQDKLYVDGHFYSDKSPVPGLLMAVLYRGWQMGTGLTAREQPDRFCHVLTLGTAGISYVVAVLCIYGLGRPLRLPLCLRLALTASFALATVALPYTRHVNNHILLLGVAAALMLGLAWLAESVSRPRGWLLLGLGTLAGLGYAIDLGVGPVLLVCTLGLVVYRCRRCGLPDQPSPTRRASEGTPSPRWRVGLVTGRGLPDQPPQDQPPQARRASEGTPSPRWRVGLVTEYLVPKSFGPVLAFGLAALPWLVLHHAVNYVIGGTFKPANANPEFFHWPGCPFTERNLTGGWQHSGVGHFLEYAAALLAGKRGFLCHNMPLFLTLPGVEVLIRRRVQELPEVVFAGCWGGGAWLMYALNSTNYSGLCCSIRWFVPLLAPGYYVLAVLLREYPRFRPFFLILSGWGAVLAVLMWWHGPWMRHMVPAYWPLQAAALLSCLLYEARRLRQENARPHLPVVPERRAEAA